MTDEHEHATKVAKVIAKAMGDNFSDAFKNKQRWTAKRGMSGGRFRDVNEPFQDDYIAAAKAAAAVIAADRAGLVAEIARMREALSRDAVRFEHCAEMIANSFEASGTLRAERTIKAEHYALEARAALKEPNHDT